jgi:predicted NAD-dependent protein-ADP-ribosyltransferase YbiA (DUF1768 family)
MYGKLTDKAKEERFHRLEKCVDSDPIPVDMTTWYDEVILMSCKDVKAWGRTVDLRPDWNDIKIKVMEEALLSKFTLNEDIKQKLKDTGDLYLEETNWWKDTFWGVCDGVGENNLGKCLMSSKQFKMDMSEQGWPELQDFIDREFIRIVNELFENISNPTSEDFWNVLNSNHWPM